MEVDVDKPFWLAAYRGTLLIKKRPPPQDPPRTLGKGYGRVLGGCIFLLVRYP